MLPFVHKIAFLIFALIAGGFGLWGFYRLSLRIQRGEKATELRFNNIIKRLKYAITISLTQERTFKDRPMISALHSLVFYGFMFYLLVNVIDGLEGFFHFSIHSTNPLGAAYNFLADVMSILVLVGVIGLVFRRLFHPSRRDFRFTDKTLLHPLIKKKYIMRDSLIVSAFISFHVGSRILGNSAKMVHEANDNQKVYDLFQPFSSLIGYLNFDHLSEAALLDWRIFGFWGALASILAFLAYFPFSKHIHLFMAPLNYALKRPVQSGVLPPMKGLEEAMEADEPKLGVEKLEDLEWPRLLDAYACIQCNRCQDVCPANTTGKALSPAALEINKRMELNMIGTHPNPFTLRRASFEKGGESDKTLLEFAINPESVWACTTCGACMEVCPVQDEQMLDIIDIRRNQVMVQGEFPQQLQTAFRGMERASNPWGISRDKRMEWADGLKVPTIDENPSPDVIYWVGCAASYDPGAQKVSRAFVQLLDKAGVNYAVLGKKEACTGDAARRAGNEFLYQQLAQENVETLNQVQPKLIVATCPHCMNAIGNEYKQIGGDYHTIHHTEYLELLVAGGKLPLEKLQDHVTYHDPCYLGRHNDVYDAPRNLISKMAGEVLDLERERENSFCCGAGGAQFWKEEEEGNDRVSDNRFREIQARLDYAAQNVKTYEETGKVVAVGCPFCKSMLDSTPEKQQRDDIVVKDVAEIMLESMQRATGVYGITADPTTPPPPVRSTATDLPSPVQHAVATPVTSTAASKPPASKPNTPTPPTQRKSWTKQDKADTPEVQAKTKSAEPVTSAPQRKKWGAKAKDVPAPATHENVEQKAPQRKKWGSKSTPTSSETADTEAKATSQSSSTESTTSERKAWKPKAQQTKASQKTETTEDTTSAKESQPTDHVKAEHDQNTDSKRKQWKPKAQAAAQQTSDPLDLDLKTTPATQDQESPTPTAVDLDPENKLESKEDTSSSTTSASQKRPKWSPKAKQTQESKPQSSETPPTKVTSDSAEPANSTRPKWQPKAKQQHTSSATDQPSTQKAQSETPPAPIPVAESKAEVKPQPEPQAKESKAQETKPQEAKTETPSLSTTDTGVGKRKKWQPKAQKAAATSQQNIAETTPQTAMPSAAPVATEDKTKTKETQPQIETTETSRQQEKETAEHQSLAPVPTPETKPEVKPETKSKQESISPDDQANTLAESQTASADRKKWQAKAKQQATSSGTDQRSVAKTTAEPKPQNQPEQQDSSHLPSSAEHSEAKSKAKTPSDMPDSKDDSSSSAAPIKPVVTTQAEPKPQNQPEQQDSSHLPSSAEHSEAKSKAKTPSDMPDSKDDSSSSAAPIKPVVTTQAEESKQVEATKPLATKKQKEQEAQAKPESLQDVSPASTSKRSQQKPEPQTLSAEKQEKAETSLPETEQPNKSAFTDQQQSTRKEKTSSTTQPQTSEPLSKQTENKPKASVSTPVPEIQPKTEATKPEEPKKTETSSKPISQTAETETTAHDKQHPSTLSKVPALPNEADLPENKTSRPDNQAAQQSKVKSVKAEPTPTESKDTEAESQNKPVQATKTQSTESETEKSEQKVSSKPTTKTSSSDKVFSAQQQPATPATRSVYSSKKAKIHKYETTPEKQKELAETEAANQPVTKGRLNWNATSRKRKTKDGEYFTKFEEKRKKQKSKKRKKK